MLDFASVCVRGEREEHFDSVGISEEDYCSCFAVADSKNSSHLSALVTDTILADFKEQSEITTATLPTFFGHAQEALTAHQQSALIRGGTAAAVLLTDGSLAVWAHIGDCRIYHLQDHLLYEITPDHSDAYTLYEAGEMRYPKIRTHHSRHHLTALLGMDQNVNPAFSTPAMMRKNDCFLLCTDGFWENIHERQIERAERHSRNAKQWLEKMQKIVEKNRARGKYTRTLDDYSAITLCL